MNGPIELDVILVADSSGKYEGDAIRKLMFAAPKLKEDAVAIAKLGAMTGWKFKMTLAPFDDDGNPVT